MRYILVLLLLAGCASNRMTPQAQQVRVVPAGFAAACTHLGMVRTFTAVIEGGAGAAHVRIRNQVAARGGNALVIVAQSVDNQGHADITGDAYRCPFTEQGSPSKEAGSAARL